eukprot:11025962-Ditylum_brightwellii.AAC.1
MQVAWDVNEFKAPRQGQQLIAAIKEHLKQIGEPTRIFGISWTNRKRQHAAFLFIVHYALE